ncbi:DUF2207 family protein [Frigoribacterium sp. 2-23]|uniref:DUF2207 family protein n=1 Tax=Frigoribacterium sp. 2-23 TaxID=3415006 RepID=UPI003C6FC4A0
MGWTTTRRRAAPAALIALLAVLAVAVGALGGAAPARADVDDFRFESMDAVYTLSRDDDGRSRLRTVETLVAEFPETDQNHGIRRTLVDSYDGHPTGLRVEGVTDGDGRDLPYELDGSEITIASDAFVHGLHTYEIRYSQRDVTLQPNDSADDEFYWDVNGTDWAQPFGRVSATVNVAPDLVSSLTGSVDAVSGAQGEANPVAATQADDGTTTAVATDLGPGENLTVAVGFRAGTFTSRPSGFFDAPWPSLSAAGALVALLALAGGVVARRRVLADAPGRGTVIAEYEPPRDVSPLLAAVLLRRSTGVPAQLLALAVAGHLRIVEEPSRGRKPRYGIQFVSADGADATGLAVLHALFGRTLTPGESRSLSTPDPKAAERVRSVTGQTAHRAVVEGYRRAVRGGLVVAVGAVSGVAAVVALVFGIVSLATSFGGPLPMLLGVGAVAAAVVANLLVARRPLTELGADTRDRLRGLELFISWAEADRIRFLQSPEGAERVAATPIGRTVAGGVLDEQRVVRLTEDLLPWAALFGQEKRWAAELAAHYDQGGQAPTWYTGQGAFTGAAFASSMGGFSSSAVSSYSVQSSGSTGGAVSGGGGGGGGGGGV